MATVSSWIVAIAAGVLVGVAGTLYFHAYRRRKDETAAGILALSGTSWRAFIRMVLEALGRRGYSRVVDHEEASGEGDFILDKDGSHWLLSCKHGSAFVLGRQDVGQLVKDVRLRGAAGGLLVTQGRITDDARPLAKSQGIELLDGQVLWPELRDLIPAEQRAAIHSQAADRARQGILLSWLFALLVAIAIFFVLPSPSQAPAASPLSQAASTPVQPAPSASAADAQAAGDDATLSLDEQRKTLQAAIATLPDVDRAVWSSESTLQIYLSRIDGDIFERICPLVVRHEQLAASRIQLTPPPSSGAMVRFRQCRSY